MMQYIVSGRTPSRTRLTKSRYFASTAGRASTWNTNTKQYLIIALKNNTIKKANDLGF